jgi:hypothetical protein
MTAVDIDEVFSEDEVATIDPNALQYVTGGRIDAGPQTVDPKVMQAFQQGSQAVQQGLQSIAQGKQQAQSQVMQMVQQMAGGGGGGPSSAGGGGHGHKQA